MCFFYEGGILKSPPTKGLRLVGYGEFKARCRTPKQLDSRTYPPILRLSTYRKSNHRKARGLVGLVYYTTKSGFSVPTSAIKCLTKHFLHIKVQLVNGFSSLTHLSQRISIAVLSQKISSPQIAHQVLTGVMFHLLSVNVRGF